MIKILDSLKNNFNRYNNWGVSFCQNLFILIIKKEFWQEVCVSTDYFSIYPVCFFLIFLIKLLEYILNYAQLSSIRIISCVNQI